MDPQFLANLIAALQSGSISYKVFYYNLERGEMYPPAHTMEEETAQLAMSGNA